MKILVLGGTAFLGRATAVRAARVGHHVVCAARGVSGQVPPEIEFHKIDRDDPSALAALDGEYDAVIDVSNVPRHVATAVEALRDRVGHWCYVSSCAVYADHGVPGQSTDAPLLPPDPGSDDSDPATFGSRKVACEQALPPGAFICRAGLIVGPEDDSNRFTYWVSRLDRGGQIAVPGSPGQRVQWIDVRDLAGWLISAAESRLAGVFNGIGPAVTREQMLAAMAAGLAVTPQLTWIDQEFLLAQGIKPWRGERSLPMWLPLPEYAGFMTRDTASAIAAGLTPRPVAETARDTLAWVRTSQPTAGAGLTPDEEAALLAAWRDR